MKTLPVVITLPKGTTRQMYVNITRIRINALSQKADADNFDYMPPLVVRNDSLTDGATVTYCNSVVIRGASRFVYRPENPLMDKGPIAWVETEAEVELTI